MTPTPTPAAAAIPVLETAEPAPPARRGRLIILLVAGVVVLGALGAGAWFFVVPRFSAPAQATAAPAAPVVKVTVPLGAVVVNLKGETRRYLRVGVSLGVPAQSDAREIDDHKSQLLDLLISTLSVADVDTLMSEEGKTELKDALLERMREELHLEKIGRVYFTEFVIQ